MSEPRKLLAYWKEKDDLEGFDFEKAIADKTPEGFQRAGEPTIEDHGNKVCFKQSFELK